MSENSSMQEQKPIFGAEDEEMSDRRGTGNNSRKVLETPRVKVGKFGLPAGVATQLMFKDIHDFRDALKATGSVENLDVDEITLPDEIWALLRQNLSLSNVVRTLQKVNGLQYPPGMLDLKLEGQLMFPM